MITPGFMVLHGNRMEALRDVLVQWLKQYPLQPLEPEVILVQSNGMAQWLKHALASDQGLGIAAGLEVSLPARFLWRTYRAVLAGQHIADRSPLDKDSLVWRLLRQLPDLLDTPGFAPLKQYLSLDDDPRRRYQLCQQVADVFDQYQMYRADWLDDWAQGHDRLGDMPLALNRSQQQTLAWQAALWRALLDDMGKQAIASSRASVHPRVVRTLEQAAERPAALPRRVVVFGMSSLPAQTLEALSAMARFSQVILCVHNPCQYYWGDIVADKDLLRHRHPRHHQRDGMPTDLPEHALHQHAHPLLAAWGKQGRDYIALLETHDEPATYAARFAQHQHRIDLFDEPDTGSLLGQLQSDILNLRPPHESRECWQHHRPDNDDSLQFHVAHSAQREVEILHDQLLHRLARDPDLQPRDVIVMVPDIDQYAPHIQAVFGQYATDDPRHIPFSVADQGQRGQEPLLIALELLLHLPELRLTTSQILSLLDVPALRKRFGIQTEDIPLLERWVAGAGARWGLDAEQRRKLDLPDHGGQNTWEFGLQRMLLGYAMGGSGAYADHLPYDEVGGLEAAALGPFVQFLEALEHTHAELSDGCSPAGWATRFHQLLTDFFEPVDTSDQLLLLALQQAADQWLQACMDAGFSQAIDLAISREAWLEGLASRQDGRGFMAGVVTFCTLMPMRAIPFEVVCLLGMNDADYPRSVRAPDFDLMDNQYRPGDRSRREDDRYLLLEALLAARQAILVSWVGRSQQDNTSLPPSVLVAQWRDHLEQVYGTGAGRDSVLAQLTVHHPLQPFSSQYFDGQRPELFSYAHEWMAVHEDRPQPDTEHPAPVPSAPAESASSQIEAASDQTEAIDISQLRRFLRQPVEHYYWQQLRVNLAITEHQDLDDEPFGLEGLARHQLRRHALEQARLAGARAAPQAIAQVLEQQRMAGELPLPPFDALHAQVLQDELTAQVQVYFDVLEGMQTVDEPLRIVVQASHVQLNDTLPIHWLDGAGQAHRIELFTGDIDSNRVKWKWRRILPFWLHHVLWHAAGQPLTTHVVGQNATLVIPPLEDAGQAVMQVNAWLDVWTAGMVRPLPIEFDTAAIWLERQKPGQRRNAQTLEQDARTAARNVYEVTGQYQTAARDQTPVLKRDFPDFDALAGTVVADRDFSMLARELYGRVHDHSIKRVEHNTPATSDGGRP